MARWPLHGVLAVLLALGGSQVARAQHPMILQKLMDWNRVAPVPMDEVVRREVLRAAVPLYPSQPDCPASAVVVDQVRPATAERYTFNAVLNGRVRNAWTVTARLPACDEAPVRYMIWEDAAGDHRTIRVNRGESHAWDSLIGDTLPLARLAAEGALRRAGATCPAQPSATLGVTRVIAEGAALGADVFGIRYSGDWSEVWPIGLCGRTVEVRVDFTADGDGGAFTDLPGRHVVVLDEASS